MKVVVLLSSYNGEKYIREQIDSILAQKGVNVEILVRDDGSADKTYQILKSYGNKISYYTGENIGVKASFFDLIKKAPSADFYAFSDQDDFWREDKLSSAVKALSCKNRPAFYFSNLITADEKLNPISQTNLNPKLTFGASMAENKATGCTIAVNKAFLEIIKRTPNPEDISMHDTYIYRLALLIGAYVYFDNTPHILYRQHGGNMIGSRGFLKKFRHYTDFFLKNKYFSRSKEAEILLKTCPELITSENIALLNYIISYKASLSAKFKLLLSNFLKTNSLTTNLIVKLAILLNRF